MRVGVGGGGRVQAYHPQTQSIVHLKAMLPLGRSGLFGNTKGRVQQNMAQIQGWSFLGAGFCLVFHCQTMC